MRLIVFAAALLLVNCGPSPDTSTPTEETAEPWYGQSVSQLVEMNRKAADLFHGGKPDDAAALILQGGPIESQILGVRRPTLAAMQASSDLDDLYGRMLLSNRHYEWAEFQFQKNVARWTHWQPQTPDTEKRLKEAQDAIAECDRGMVKKAKFTKALAAKKSTSK